MKLPMLHGKPVEKARKLVETWSFKGGLLDIKSAPRNGRYGTGYLIIKNEFDPRLWEGTSLALEHFILRHFYKGAKNRKINWIQFQRPTRYLIQRSGIRFEKDKISILFHYTVPTKDNRINGKEIFRGFEKEIPELCNSIKNLDKIKKEIMETKTCLEKQIAIKRYLVENNALAFIGEGTVVGNSKVRIRNAEKVPTEHGRVLGILIPRGRTEIPSRELLQLISRGYAYSKPGTGFEFVKSIRDLAFIEPGDERIAEYAKMTGVISDKQVEYKNSIVLGKPGETGVYNNIVGIKDGVLTKAVLKSVLFQGSEGKETAKSNNKRIGRIPNNLKLDGRIRIGNESIDVAPGFLETFVERSQIRAVQDAIKRSKPGDVWDVTSKIISEINKHGLSWIGNGFYSEFTRWQIFFPMYLIASEATR